MTPTILRDTPPSRTRRSTAGVWPLLFSGAYMAAACVGCGDGPEASVSGEVSLDGAPLERGFITFSPTSGGGNASGQIGAGGSYLVQAGRTGGLPAGEYRVAVSSRSESTPTQSGGPPAPGRLLTPPRYANADTSGLVVEVKRGSNVHDIKLTTD